MHADRPRNPVLLPGLLLASALLATALPAQAPPLDPASLPAHDVHQGLLVAVRPDATAAASRARFGRHAPYDAGIIALDVYFRNDNDQAIRINLQTLKLSIGAPGEKQQHLEPLSDAEVADLCIARPDPSLRRRTPIPGVGPKINR